MHPPQVAQEDRGGNMGHDIRRQMIESSVRRALGRMEGDPDRAVRNLVDLAVDASRGEHQRPFFCAVRDLLQGNEDSAYFSLARRLVQEVDVEHLLTFGLNLGYEGCVRGAETIRDVERTRGFNVPWMLSIEMPDAGLGPCGPAGCGSVTALVHEARELGIHVFLVHAGTHCCEAIDLAAVFPDCAFAIVVDNRSFSVRAASLAQMARNALMLAQAGQGAGYVCSLLASLRLPYGVYLQYPRSLDASPRIVGRSLSRMLALKPHFAVLSPAPWCTAELARATHARVRELREEQAVEAIVMDAFGDSLLIDSIISQDQCAMAVDALGRPVLFDGPVVERGCNVYRGGLAHALAELFPKTAAA